LSLKILTSLHSNGSPPIATIGFATVTPSCDKRVPSPAAIIAYLIEMAKVVEFEDNTK
jgi:hypothetical protein